MARTVGMGAKKPKKNKETTALEKRLAEPEQKLTKPKNAGEGK